MEDIRWPAGFKRTKQRQQVYEVLARAEKPLDAQEIYRRMAQETGGLAVSTVYRILAAFAEQGLVTRTTIMGDDTALYSLRHDGHAHYAFCLRCHRQIPLKHCPLEYLPLQEEADGFTVTDHRLELYGYCRDCREKK